MAGGARQKGGTWGLEACQFFDGEQRAEAHRLWHCKANRGVIQIRDMTHSYM